MQPESAKVLANRASLRPHHVAFCCCAVLLIAGPETLRGTELTFDIAGIVNGDEIPRDYGDRVVTTLQGGFRYGDDGGWTPGIEVEYRTVNATDATDGPLKWWEWTSTGRTGTAYPAQNGDAGEVELVPDDQTPGIVGAQSVELHRLTFVGFANLTNQSVTIFDERGQDIWSQQGISLPGGGSLTLEPNLVSNGNLRIRFGDNWNMMLTSMTFGQRLRGDFDNDDTVSVDDINTLVQRWNAHEPFTNADNPYDLDVDRRISVLDHEHLITDILRTSFGDANLDRTFDSRDFVEVFICGLYETGLPAGWECGDWNGDRVFDSTDITHAFTHGEYDTPAAASRAVPEPMTACTLLPFLLGFVCIARRR